MSWRQNHTQDMCSSFCDVLYQSDQSSVIFFPSCVYILKTGIQVLVISMIIIINRNQLWPPPPSGKCIFLMNPSLNWLCFKIEKNKSSLDIQHSLSFIRLSQSRTPFGGVSSLCTIRCIIYSDIEVRTNVSVLNFGNGNVLNRPRNNGHIEVFKCISIAC